MAGVHGLCIYMFINIYTYIHLYVYMDTVEIGYHMYMFMKHIAYHLALAESCDALRTLNVQCRSATLDDSRRFNPLQLLLQRRQLQVSQGLEARVIVEVSKSSQYGLVCLPVWDRFA